MAATGETHGWLQASRTHRGMSEFAYEVTEVPAQDPRTWADMFGCLEEFDAGQAAYDSLESWERELHDEIQREIDRAIVFGETP